MTKLSIFYLPADTTHHLERHYSDKCCLFRKSKYHLGKNARTDALIPPKSAKKTVILRYMKV